MSNSEQNVHMQRSLRAIDLWSLALGAMIGWGCFVLPGNMFLRESGPLGTFIGMMIGAAMTIVISLSFTYLIQKFPVSGGAFVYADAAFGKLHAFICGWFLVLTYWCLIPLNGTAVGLVARYIFPGVLSNENTILYQVAGWDVYAGELVVAILSIVILAWVNVRGVSFTGAVQTAVAMGLVGAILLLVAGALWQQPELSNLSPGYGEAGALKGIFAVAAIAPWAFIGFDSIPQAAGEYRFSQKKTILIMVSATFIAGLMYVIVNTVTAVVMPWQDLINSDTNWATGTAVEMLLGKVGLILVAIAMICAVVSGLNAFFLSASRVMYTMAKADALPAYFGKLDPVTAIPKNGIVFLCALAVIAPFFGREVLNWIVDMTSVGASLGFLYTCSAAAVFAKRYGDKKFVIIGVFGSLFSLLFLGLLLIPIAPGALSIQAYSALGIWVLLGAIFYLVIRKKYLVSDKLSKMVDEALEEVAK